MYAKRLQCKKCGRTLLTGCSRNVCSVECTCGCVVYPNSTDRDKTAISEIRHKKYKQEIKKGKQDEFEY